MFAPSALRQARTFTICFQPGFIAPCASAAAAPFSTKTSTRPAQQQCTQRPSFRPSPLALAIRYASTTAASTSTANPTSSSSQQLTWNDFFALRKTRRRASQVTSGISAIGVAYAGLQVFIGGGYDGLLAASIGLDPIITTGLASAGMLTVGWLLGPFFSNAVFNVRNRAIAPQIAKVGPLFATFICRGSE
jgi:import inner membrane translocase subunit TIM23